MDLLTPFARVIHVVVLGWWMGAYAHLVRLSRAVESVLASRHETGAVLLAALADLERFGLWGVPVLWLTLWIGWASFSKKRRGRTTGIVLLALFTLTSRYVARPRFQQIRQELGRPVEDLGLADPALADYVTWERTLVVIVLLQAATAFVLLAWAVLQNRPRQSFGIEL